MKKLIFATAILLAATTTTFAQDGDDVAFTKGSSSVSLGYGFLSPYKKLFKLSNLFGATDPDVSSKYSSLGPIAVTYEYGATEKIGVGLQVGYATNKNVTTDVNGLGAGKPYISTETLTQLSVIARVNYHFGSSPKFDPYAGLGLGYGNFTYKTTTNDPTDTPADLALFKISVPGAFGITGQLGAKYYFSDNFGAYAEVGYLAGSFAQLGVTVKF
jgi:outer membrane protein W